MEELRTLARLTMDGCENIVRYFQGWVEEEEVYIQTELCDGTVAKLYQQGKFKGNEREVSRRSEPKTAARLEPLLER